VESEINSYWTFWLWVRDGGLCDRVSAIGESWPHGCCCWRPVGRAALTLMSVPAAWPALLERLGETGASPPSSSRGPGRRTILAAAAVKQRRCCGRAHRAARAIYGLPSMDSMARPCASDRS